MFLYGGVDMGETYVVTFVRETEVDEPLWSVDKDGKAYISGWLKTVKNKMYNTIFYGIENIEKWLERRAKNRPDARIITWQKISNYNG